MKIYEESELIEQALKERIDKARDKKLKSLEIEIKQLKSKLNLRDKRKARREIINKFSDEFPFTKRQRKLLVVLAGCRSIDKTKLVERVFRTRDLNSLMKVTRKRLKLHENNLALLIKVTRRKPCKYSLEFPTIPSLNW